LISLTGFTGSFFFPAIDIIRGFVVNSVAAAKADVFQKNEITMGIKLVKI
jgi:hypothetical protein